MKMYPRDELIKRVMLQYNYRCFQLHTTLNDLDFKAVNLLVTLSINSPFEIVRQEARQNLFDLLGQYPYSAMTILPSIVKFLNKTHSDKKFTNEQLEGCLLLLKGKAKNNQTSMLVKQNWFILCRLWPCLFKSKFFDRTTVHKLLDKIYFNANLNFQSFNNNCLLSENLLQLAKQFCPTIEIDDDEETRLKTFRQKNAHENQLISKLMEDLISIARDTSLIWKSQEISLFSLIFLLNSCEMNIKLLSEECVEVFVDSLINQNINLRRVCFSDFFF